MKIATIVGARPQFIKAAALSRALTADVEEVIIHTGQHFDSNMSDVFFKELSIPSPKYNLQISGGSHGNMTGKMISAIEEVLIKEKPDCVVLYGDTNSTCAGALAAVKLMIPIVHIEAGGRVGSLENPEEANRIVADHLSTLLFAVSDNEMDNLRKENLGERSYVVGNIMYDSYLYADAYCDHRSATHFCGIDGDDIVLPEEFYYLTCHRQENTYDDQPLTEILDAMERLDAPTIYPVHPRNQERVKRLRSFHSYSGIRFIEPVGYMESIYLLKHCKKVVTDSGGLQCEAFYARKQCVTIFDYVTWPQTMVGNRNQLAKAESRDILDKLSCKMVVREDYMPFGDGHTAERIIKVMKEKLEGRP